MLRAAPHSPTALLLAAAVIALGACGSSDDTTTGQATTRAAPAQQEPGRYTVKEVAKLAGFAPAADRKTWTSATGCRITLILTTHAEILKYRTSSDALVVTNGADDIGVKFDPTAGCREALLANLSTLK